MRSEWQLRQEIVAIGRKVYERRFVAATDGNISARIMGDRILVTPAGSCLGELKPEELVYVESGKGRPGRGLHPTSELPMHLAAYEVRPDIGAIVHAHPPLATAFTIAGQSLTEPVLPEVVIHLGSIPTAEYATTSTEKVAEVVRDLIREHDAILLDRHGSVTVGEDLVDAYRKLEKVEHSAEVVLAAHQLGVVQTLSEEEVARLARLREAAGRSLPVYSTGSRIAAASGWRRSG